MKKYQLINYKNTINLPKINFPMKGNLNQKEPQIIKDWNKNNLYFQLKNKKKIKKNTSYMMVHHMLMEKFI